MNKSNSSDIDFSKYNAFFFDLDGTLINTSKLHAMAVRETLKNDEQAAKYAKYFKDEDVLGRGSDKVFRSLKIEDKALINKLIEKKRKLYKEYLKTKDIDLFDRVIDLLCLLQLFEKQIFLVTSSTKDTATAALEKTKLKQFFKPNHIITSNDSKDKQSKRELFELALKRSKENANNTITIEDDSNAYKASKEANIFAIIVNKKNPESQWDTFETFESLFYAVYTAFHKKLCSMSDTKTALNEYFCGTQEIKNLHNRIENRLREYSPEEFKNRLKDYTSQSDKEFVYLLTLAKKLDTSLYLYRIAGSLLIRYLLENYLKDKRYWRNIIIDLFSDLSSMKVLLPNPDKTEFLHRMDCENVKNWGIWRIRQEVLLFARALLQIASDFNKKEFAVSFHENQVVWNFGVVENIVTLIRAYNHGTGHDGKVTSEWLYFYTRNKLAESFLNFWHVTNRQKTTKPLSLDWVNNQMKSFPQWSGLFKGNATLVTKEDFDHEDPDAFDIENEDYVLKICRNEKENQSEQKILESISKNQSGFRYFKAVKLIDVKRDLNHLSNDYFEHKAIAIERIKGITLDDILFSIFKIAQKDPQKRLKASSVLGALIKRSMRALEEFQNLARNAINNLENYPYAEKLTSALFEVEGVLESSNNLQTVIKEAQNLGNELSQYVKEEGEIFPFRDAHLKNSMWQTDNNVDIDDFAATLLEYNIEKLDKEVASKIKDIDFETCGYNVTRWEDPIHILFFELSGIDPTVEEGHPKTYLNYIRYFTKWCGKPIRDERGFWCTVLARSIREFCRRLWYMKTLPNTYKTRYKNENITYFNHLGLLAIYELKKTPDKNHFPKIEEFLNIQLKSTKKTVTETLKRPLYPSYTRKEIQQKINILHLSDLHFEGGTDSAKSPEQLVDKLIEDLRIGDYNDENRPVDHLNTDSYIDYIVITGDFIAAENNYKARANKFKIAEQFIHNLMIELDTWEDRCILVPGNHDVYTGEYGKGKYTQFKEFHKSITKTNESDCITKALSITNDDSNNIEFICLNSCFRENRDNQSSTFSPTAFECIAPKEQPFFRIAALHHPLECIEKHNDNDINKLVLKFSEYDIDMILHGHLHEIHGRVSKENNALGVGSFGASHKRLPEGTPRYYSLISIDRTNNEYSVYYRKQTNPNNNWETPTSNREVFSIN